jgi:hypothetical protein
VYRLGERLDRERLCQPRHPLEQHVPAREQPDQQSLDHVLLPHHTPANLLKDVLDERSVADGHRPCCHASAPGENDGSWMM